VLLLAGAALVCLGSFRPPAAEGQALAVVDTGDPAGAIQRGEAIFVGDFTPRDGLGPLFNGTSCASCHNAPSTGGMGADGLGVVIRIGRGAGATFDSLIGRGGPVARRHSVGQAGDACFLEPGIPEGVTVTSVRNAPALFGSGLIAAVADETILAGAVPKEGGVHGRPNLIVDADGTTRVGRFGWKADTASLEQFVAEAFRNEHGITNPLATTDIVTAGPAGAAPCAEVATVPEDDGTMVSAVTSFVAALPVPSPRASDLPSLVTRGELVFNASGCVACHTAGLPTAQGEARLYSDLLLHDMGPALDDGVTQGDAVGRDWRTSPLWGLGSRVRFLHDGRARSVTAAIQAHGGEAAASVARFRGLADDERAALLAFLGSL
jgi:CxxC motif-containing protein (DUF1111 family)